MKSGKTDDVGILGYGVESFSGNIPLQKSKKNVEHAKQFYQLGRTSASLDRQQKDILEMQRATLMQQMLLQQQKSQMSDILSNIKLNSAMLDMKTQESMLRDIQSTQYPPLNSGQQMSPYDMPMDNGQQMQQYGMPMDNSQQMQQPMSYPVG